MLIEEHQRGGTSSEGLLMLLIRNIGSLVRRKLYYFHHFCTWVCIGKVVKTIRQEEDNPQ